MKYKKGKECLEKLRKKYKEYVKDIIYKDISICQEISHNVVKNRYIFISKYEEINQIFYIKIYPHRRK